MWRRILTCQCWMTWRQHVNTGCRGADMALECLCSDVMLTCQCGDMALTWHSDTNGFFFHNKNISFFFQLLIMILHNFYGLGTVLSFEDFFKRSINYKNN